MPECDYYTNPTILSQCIKMDDFAAASRRLANHPDEARVWVVRRISTPPVEKSSPPSPAVAKVAVYQPTAERQIVTTSRALPIHMVLARESLAAFCEYQQRARNQLLAGLITSYPDACALRAPNTRQYIVETLIEQHATTQLVSLALAACPAALDRIAPAVLQPDSDLPERLRRLVGRGRAFWEQVREYAQLDQTNDQHPDHDGNDKDDNNDDDDNDEDEDKNNKGDGGGVETTQANKSIVSLAWSNGIQDYKALEQRCLTLERMVLAANVENFELQQELTKRDEMIAKLKVDMEEQVRDILDNLQSSPQPLQPPSSAAVAPTTTKWLESIQERPSAAATSSLAPLTTAPPGTDRPVPLPIVPDHQSPPSLRRHDCTSTIVSSLSLDRSRYPSQSSRFGSNNNNEDDDDNDDDNDDDDDDEDTKALLDAIGRPMSPLEPLQLIQRKVLDEQQQQQRSRRASAGPEPSDKNHNELTASAKRRESIQKTSNAASRPPLPRPPPPPALRRQDCSSNTIISSLSLDQSRYPSGRFTRADVDNVDDNNNADDGDDDDDEDTYALLDAIARPMSPLEPLVRMANKEVHSQQLGTLPFVPVLDETSVDDDDATLDTILREAELWTGRKLSPSVVRAWMQIPSPFKTEMEATTTDRVVGSRGNSTHRSVA
jgi:hypothetical protein